MAITSIVGSAVRTDGRGMLSARRGLWYGSGDQRVLGDEYEHEQDYEYDYEYDLGRIGLDQLRRS